MSAKFYIVSISVEGLTVLHVPADLEWAMIVAFHRGRMEKIKGTPFYDKYPKMTHGKDLMIGYIYRYWHYYTEESSKAIYKQAPVETMKTNYLMFHTMAPEVAIEDLKEIYKQRNSKLQGESHGSIIF